MIQKCLVLYRRQLIIWTNGGWFSVAYMRSSASMSFDIGRFVQLSHPNMAYNFDALHPQYYCPSGKCMMDGML